MDTIDIVHEDKSLICHRCGTVLRAGEGSFHVVRIEAFADPSPPSEHAQAEFAAEGVARGYERLLEQMRGLSEQELMDQVYRRLSLILCVPCYQHWIENPTG